VRMNDMDTYCPLGHGRMRPAPAPRRGVRLGGGMMRCASCGCEVYRDAAQPLRSDRLGLAIERAAAALTAEPEVVGLRARRIPALRTPRRD
jgi:hypothetical protein